MECKWHRAGGAVNSSGRALGSSTQRATVGRTSEDGGCPWGRQKEAGGHPAWRSRARPREGKGSNKGDGALRMGSVRCLVGGRVSEPGGASRAWCEGRASHIRGSGLVVVVKPLGSNIIHNLRQVTS